MSETADQGSKTQEPTEKRISDALEKGNTPFSREASIVGSMFGILLVASLLAPRISGELGLMLARFIEQPGNWTLATNEDGATLLHAVSRQLFVLLVPALAILLVTGVVASLIQSPPRLALERLRPKLSKISPAQGLKRVMGQQGLAEFMKAAAKLAIVTTVSIIILRSEFNNVIAAMHAEPFAIPANLHRGTARLLSGVVLVSLLLAIADILWSRHTWRRQLMMTHQEIKDEHKQSDGDPLVKSRLRSLAKDRTRRRMIADVPRATLVIANPTHYAIALRFQRGHDDAPVVVAKGRELLALKIREIAEEHAIPVIEDKPLARSMYNSVEVDQMIPEEFYEAVARLIYHVSARDRTARPLAGERN
jgi:flagellar biosynthetic protein FlhB